MASVHVSVLPNEVLAGLAPQPGETVVDCTTGVGGHLRLLAERVGPTGTAIGLDQDPTMLALARANLVDVKVRLFHANFEDLPDVLQNLQSGPVDVVLADLGFCSDQLANPERGFSFQHDGPLDMRLDPTRGEPASELVQRLPERELADTIWRFGDERHSRRIARAIVEARKTERLATTAQLADLVRRCVPRQRGVPIDPATRTFQALRIAVNDELGALERFLSALPGCVKVGGRAGVVSFHSLEDRLVKQAFRTEVWEPLTRKPIEASDEETARNPRARSAKLRIARRLQPALPGYGEFGYKSSPQG